MKKSDLKQLIKPIVKECIHETLIEEGLLSNVVSEVVKGMQVAPLVENRSAPIVQEKTIAAKSKEAHKKIAEHRQKMLEAVGTDAYNGVNLFEGTSPLPTQEPTPGRADLGDPGDAGVDIGSLVGNASQIWRAMK
jgi:hypothetical protein